MDIEQGKARLGQIEAERLQTHETIRELRLKLGELANEAWGIHCDIARQQRIGSSELPNEGELA